MKITRFVENPIITPEMDASIGANINGPSIITVPDWIKNPLGRYYLYFADHRGEYIRLAYADRLNGPWRIYQPGTLKLPQTPCVDHIASPDVHVDDENHRIVMYYHGVIARRFFSFSRIFSRIFLESVQQKSFCAFSPDGLNFISQRNALGESYFRVFQWRGRYYAQAMPGIFYRSQDRAEIFVRGPTLFDENMRHSGLLMRDRVLYVFYSNVGDCPEHILLSKITLSPDWMEWRESPPISVIYPEEIYEGSDLEPEPSVRGAACGRVRQLRDPYVFEEDKHLYLLYSVAGESGIAVAEIEDIEDI